MLITPLFAALFGLIYIGLSANVIRYRLSKQISLGDNGDKAVERAIRTHGNFIEYVPLSLILFYFIEILSLSGQLVFVLGTVLLISRIGHIIGMLNPKRWFILRQIGAVGTFTVILISCCALILHYIPLNV